ncbi:SDR family oxidoreductase [Mucilaginibacter sp. AW1-3]
MHNTTQFSSLWAIILGGSSGLGLAAAEKLASHGMNIAVLYRESAGTERSIKQIFAALAAKHEVTIQLFNINALDGEARGSFIDRFVADDNKKHKVKLLLHSISRGNLKPLFSEELPADAHNVLSVNDIQYTSYAMATSMLDWVRGLLKADAFAPDARIVGLTSDGAHKYWDGYAAVSIAKASLESLATYMAVEFGKQGLKTNLIQAGITQTPSLNKIPGSEKLVQFATERNPLGRITQPADVANAIYLLCTDEASWINGAVIHVDGGEHCL